MFCHYYLHLYSSHKNKTLHEAIVTHLKWRKKEKITDQILTLWSFNICRCYFLTNPHYLILTDTGFYSNPHSLYSFLSITQSQMVKTDVSRETFYFLLQDQSDRKLLPGFFYSEIRDSLSINFYNFQIMQNPEDYCHYLNTTFQMCTEDVGSNTPYNVDLTIRWRYVVSFTQWLLHNE